MLIKLMGSDFVEVSSLVNEDDVLVGKLTPIARDKSTEVNDLSHSMLTNETSVRYIDSLSKSTNWYQEVVVLEITKRDVRVGSNEIKQMNGLKH